MNLTVLITASFCKFHPSLIIISKALLSLRYLHLKYGTDVLLFHDRPPRIEMKFDLYIRNLNHSMLSIRECIQNIQPRLVLTNQHMHQAKALAFALSLVKTEFFLKMEHDHVFVRRILVYEILYDMMHDHNLKIVRFNRRQNKIVNCDSGYYTNREKKRISRRLWKEYKSVSQTYTRTVCFSDMNHISRLPFYTRTIASPAAKKAPQMIETTIQPLVVNNHTMFGTYIYGAPRFNKTLSHLDASRHNHGELDHNRIAKIRAQPVWNKFFCTK